jgi:hypothetical protein
MHCKGARFSAGLIGCPGEGISPQNSLPRTPFSFLFPHAGIMAKNIKILQKTREKGQFLLGFLQKDSKNLQFFSKHFLPRKIIPKKLWAFPQPVEVGARPYIHTRIRL